MLGKILRKLDMFMTKLEEWMLFIIVMTGLLSLFANVVLRYGFNYTLAWSEELVRIVIIYSTFVGASVAVKQRAMIRIDAIVQIFPRLKPGLTIYSNLFMLFFAFMMVYYGYQMTALQYMTHQKTVCMEIPLVIIYSIMPIMGVMMFIRTIQVMVQDFRSK
jgi:TRAP-type C4-dicarboxylate transport system permease small subunit